MPRLVLSRSRTWMSLAVLATVAVWSTPARPQTLPPAPAASAPAGGPTMVIGAQTAPAPTPAPAAPASAPAAPATVPIIPPSAGLPVPSTAPGIVAAPATASGDLPPVTQPFVATMTTDKVNLRSGPDVKYYEIGQLSKGDLVYVVGTTKGWYMVLPPNGTFGMIAKEYVELDTGTPTGTVKGEHVNVRVGVLKKDADPYAVMMVASKGTKLKILGSTDKYYQIAPPEGSKVYVKSDYIKAAAGTDYKVATLKLPVGAIGPTGITVEAPTTLPTVAVVVPTPEPTPTPTPTGTAPSGGTVIPPVLPPVIPAAQFSETATSRFRETNAKYQEEAKKTLADQNLEGLLKDFQDILALDNISPSVKEGSKADIAVIERTLSVQRLMKEQATAKLQTQAQSEALQRKFKEVEDALAAARESGPYVAQGVLQTSTIVTGKYALVNPQTQRVVAYVDPATADVDIGSLVGKYVGVRGISKKMEGSDITVIQVSNATLLPLPK